MSALGRRRTPAFRGGPESGRVDASDNAPPRWIWRPPLVGGGQHNRRTLQGNWAVSAGLTVRHYSEPREPPLPPRVSARQPLALESRPGCHSAWRLSHVVAPASKSDQRVSLASLGSRRTLLGMASAHNVKASRTRPLRRASWRISGGAEPTHSTYLCCRQFC